MNAMQRRMPQFKVLFERPSRREYVIPELVARQLAIDQRLLYILKGALCGNAAKETLKKKST